MVITRKPKSKQPITFDSLHIEVLRPRELTRNQVANGCVTDFLRTVALCKCALCKKVPIRGRRVHVTIRVHQRLLRTAGSELRRARHDDGQP